MNISDLKDKWMQIVRTANEKGIPLPMLKIDGKATFSGTLTFIAFNIWVISAVGKAAGYLGGMNPDQCLNMFLACAGLYFGRKFQKDGNKSEISEKVIDNADAK